MVVTNAALMRELKIIEAKVGVVMSQNDEIAAETTQIEATATAIQAGVTAALAHITDLEAQVAAGQPVSQQTLDGLKQAVTDIGAAGQGVTGLATA
jgi:hypothetical protein